MPLFERDRYQRLDGAGGPGRRPSSFCSSATIVVFVALCLVGAWMMASSSNIPVSVSPENKQSEAKEADRSVDFTPRVNGGGDDATQTGDEGGDTGKKDGGGSDTPQLNGDEGYGNGNKGDGAGATQTTDASGSNYATRGDVAATTEATSSSTTGAAEADETSKPAPSAVADGETPSKNQTFSDENGKTEGGEVAKPDDPEKKVQHSAEETTTGGQADNNAKPEVTGDDKDTGNQVAKSDPETSTTDANDDTGGQVDTDSVSQDQETPTESSNYQRGSTEGNGGGMPKNQTTFEDANGKVNGLKQNEAGEVAENIPAEDYSNDKAQSTDDETAAAGVAAKNGTLGEQSEAIGFAAADGTNGTISSQDATNSSATTDGNTAENTELLPSGQADLLNETASSVVAEKATFPTQAAESSEEKKKNKKKHNKGKGVDGESTEAYTWKLCNVTAGADYIPCLDNEAAIKSLKSNKHYEHRERHCPSTPPTCLVPLPEGYRQPIPWPHSRDKIWYHNVPHAKLASYKGHQNWVKISGEHLTFPGGGTQFKHGAAHYIGLVEEALPEDVAWGRRGRVVLDVGCGVASFGGFLFDRDALTMSFAPKDEHEAQVQFALERGIPAVSAVMGTLRLPFPGNVFDVVHCARCRVPWHIEGGKLLLEVNRLLRPGGLFIWSATPVYRKVPEDVEIWHAMAALTKSMCWEMLKKTRDTVDQTAMVVFKKPTSNDCYDARTRPDPPLCEASDDQDAAWNVTLQACMHRVPTGASARGSRWPAQWPERLAATPYWLHEEQTGVYGKSAPADFAADQEHWRKVAENSYLDGMGIDWKNVRNVMDMRAVYGGFAAALRDKKVWVMNVVTIDSPDTLPIIYERGLFGMYHDWCESFSTYPRSYDLVHADHLFSKLKNRCKLPAVMVEVDRILRPDGKLIVRDDKETAEEVQSIAKSLHWEVRMTVSRQGQELLCFRKTTWRPTEVEALS